MKFNSKTWRDFNPSPYAPGIITKLATAALFVWFVDGVIKAF